jgi:choline kinase
MPVDPGSCRVLILAAGQGRRLGASVPPKVLLDFEGSSLLTRHIRILDNCGLRDITVVIGYRAEELRAEIVHLSRLRAPGVNLVRNPSFRNGSIVSLWRACAVLRSGAPVILMDADVLYDSRLIVRLLDSPHESCFLLDRSIEPGEEPVKLCIDRGRIVDFHKRPQIEHQWHGESVGFFRFSPAIAAELAERVDEYIAEGRTQVEYEEPIRDLLLARDGSGFGYEDISGLPWIEIDFPADVERARRVVVPQLIA